MIGLTNKISLHFQNNYYDMDTLNSEPEKVIRDV